MCYSKIHSLWLATSHKGMAFSSRCCYSTLVCEIVQFSPIYLGVQFDEIKI